MFGLLYFFLFGCSDNVLLKVPDREPEILVIPSKIDFGHIESGIEKGIQDINIINTGDDLLSINPLEIIGDNKFIIVSNENIELEAGESVTLQIEYNPITYENNFGLLQIDSDDDDEPSTTVEIIGSGDAPVIDIDPLYYDFGIVDIGCENELEIQIKNTGNLPLTITDIQQLTTLPADLELDLNEISNGELPWIIPAFNSIRTFVSYIPEDTTTDYCSIDILADDPLQPITTITQDAAGDYFKTIVESFEQEEIRAVDILFVIDNSGSMGMIQGHVANNLGSFISVFSSQNIDYNIAFITTDDENFIGPIISPASADPVNELINQVNSIGIHGSGVERGLEYSYRSLSPGGDASPGGTFFREDATLAIIYISDEPDYSLSPWMDYATYFDTLKTDASLVSAHAIIGDYPSGCQWTNGSYTRNIGFGDDYYDIAQYYSGGIYSICAADWGSQMHALALGIAPVLKYPLSSMTPMEDTISVTVDGTPNFDWSYDAMDNSIEFPADNPPHEGAIIEVIYSLWGCNE